METNRRMGRSATWLVGLICTAITPIAYSADEAAVAPETVLAPGAGAGMAISAMDVIPPEDIVPVPEHFTVSTHVYRDGQVVQNLSALPEKQIYSNSLGQRILRFGTPNRRIADDLITDSINGCNLSRYVVRVNGGVPNGVGEFSCKTALFTGCPSVANGLSPIPGTEGEFEGLPDDSTEMHDLVVDVSSSPVPIPPTVWVRVECSTAASGWVGAAPAEIGFTQDRFFFPTTGCDSFLGPTFYCGFYTQIYADDPPAMPCDTHFVAYAATSPTLPALNCGAGQPCADDFTTILAPTGESCILSAYEVGMRGNSGAFTMTLDLRVPFTDFAIPGTEFTFTGKGDNRVELARHVVDPNLDIIIPSSPLWVKWDADKGTTGLINARFPAAGFSADEFFARFTGPPPFWAPQLANPRAAVYLIIYCKGDTPRGSCCRNQLAGNNQPIQCTDNLPITACLRPARWLKDRTCMENAFEPPCGEHACCTPGGCQDSTYTECATFQDPSSLGLPCTNNSHCPGRVCQPDGFCSPRAGVWQIGSFCDPGVPIGVPFECAFYQCYFALGDCFDAEEQVDCCTQPNTNCNPSLCPLGTRCQPQFGTCTSRGGCNNVNCCDEVCGQDSFCCSVMWDNACVNRAVSNCELAPGNDICANDTSLAVGAQDVPLTPFGATWRGFAEANNSFAIAHPGDPFACCNKGGVDVSVAGTLWYKFVMPIVPSPGTQPTTARLHTCATPGSDTAIDPVLAVFSVGDLSSEAAACATLDIIACNDDREDCGSGQQADICVQNLMPGATYYVMLGSSNSAFQGLYALDIEVPCNRALPNNNVCASSEPIQPVSPVNVTFDLTNATLDCPSEDCVNAMKNDVWYDYVATCLGKTTFETCGLTANDADPETALAVYRVNNLMDTCDVDTGDLVGCNDNALVNPAEHTRRSQTCEFSGLECDTSSSCQFRCSVSGNVCTTKADCHFCGLQLDRPCDTNADCLTCLFADPVTGDPVSCTVPSQTPTAECPGTNNSCRFTSDNSCVKPNDTPTFEELCAKEPCLSSCGNAASVTIPVSPGQFFKVRMGGDFGAEVDGFMKVTCTPQDCNNNNQSDLREIQMGTAFDCNENEQIDACEIAAQPSRDCNNNGLLDVCEIDRDSLAPGGPFFCIANCKPDCNLNGKIDSCDIAACTSPSTPGCKDCNNNMKPDSCDIADGTSMDVDMDGVPDNCGGTPCNAITLSVPADCDIESRQPHDLKNASPAQGPTTMQLTLSGQGCTPNTLTAANFTVTVQPAGGPVPTISNVSGAGAVATLTFAAPIPTNKWTCVALAGVTPAQEVCIGFLPADVNGSRVSNTQDTDALRLALNGAPALPLAKTDMNRSGIMTAEDLIAHINLLNGGDTFVPWATQTIAVPCP